MTAMPPRLLLILGLFLLAAVLWFGLGNTRAGVESPDYTVVSKDGDFEVRRYPDMKGAATSMTAADGDGRNSGFGRLFRYISGDNEGKNKIAMTSPVFVEADGEAREQAMIFVMPKATVAAGVPDPASDTVTVKTLKGGDFAVLRFKGYRSKTAPKEAHTRLREWIAAAGLKAEGEPVFAYYDPPWIPEALRRNEVLLRVSGVPAE
jgi:hypothetical protein